MKKLLPLLVVAILLLCTSCSDGATQIEIITTPSNFDGNTNMTNTQAETSTATINNPYPGEVLYKGIPVLSFFNSGYYDALGLIGDPLKEELVDSDSTLFRYDYDAMQIFAYAQTGELTSVVATDPSAFSMNGITLDKDRAGIIKIFGNPSAEWDDRGYGMVYQFDDLQIYVSMNIPMKKHLRF